MRPRGRDWTEGVAKCQGEGRCRRCHGPHPQAAHIIPRSQIPAGLGAEDFDNFIPLCEVRGCHSAYDRGELDILPLLTKREQAKAVELVGLVAALERTTGAKWLPVESTPIPGGTR